MTATFIVRLLDPDHQLLSWASVSAVATPQGGRASCPFHATPGVTRFVVEQEGTVATLVVHWPELDVVRVKAQPPMAVKAGQALDYIWLEPVWLVAGMKDVVLPAVTVRAPVQVIPPTGGLSSRDSRLTC